MKTIKYITILTLVSFLFLGCKKIISNDNVYTVEGRFMYNCETPASDIEFLFIQGSPGLIEIKSPLSLMVKSDAEGYFKIVYKGKDSNNSDFDIRKSGTVLYDIPASENVNLGNVYFSPTFSFTIRLDVVNPYTSNDTLELPNYNDAFNENNNRIYIPGPFVNGVIDTVLNLPDMSSIRYKSASTFRVQHRINNNDWIDTELKITNHCTGELYEAVIKIE